ncbi:uncharacterized protein PGTG_16533 [Puccinia graminis f. sp. tritici CRL 75-36-700-3]|uniref:Uncharacterized protein n=1 Tax=Puccinia graminis f. sp. tritici (strain CRL 75-36-700-3 / race SCCL) TaxID=418459 RepID=E3L130_PUCGT|nr:uncharacterized protein PGTG_16533 [Puccinia graminis f. sp. tritici CRL 75-36-700-3]EFP90255.2 hypothetical protein PGTG_16533 [Puccinia graminis f. sp. tritici CRL 75-36-700-3]
MADGMKEMTSEARKPRTVKRAEQLATLDTVRWPLRSWRQTPLLVLMAMRASGRSPAHRKTAELSQADEKVPAAFFSGQRPLSSLRWDSSGVQHNPLAAPESRPCLVGLVGNASAGRARPQGPERPTVRVSKHKSPSPMQKKCSLTSQQSFPLMSTRGRSMALSPNSIVVR